MTEEMYKHRRKSPEERQTKSESYVGMLYKHFQVMKVVYKKL